MPQSDQSPNKPKKSRHAQIVQELGIKILSGEFTENEKLPNEAEICEKFNISRPVFREAIRVLNSKGLTYSRPKVGTVVRPKEDWHLLDADVLQWMVQSMPENQLFKTLSTVRRVLEPELAFIAATSATQEDIDRIERAYDGMSQATTVEDFITPDIQFHLAVAKATHNDLLAYMSRMLVLPLKQSLQITSLRPNLQRHSLPRHEAILNAIKNKDPLSARYASIVQLEDTTTAYNTIKPKSE